MMVLRFEKETCLAQPAGSIVYSGSELPTRRSVFNSQKRLCKFLYLNIQDRGKHLQIQLSWEVAGLFVCMFTLPTYWGQVSPCVPGVINEI